MSSIFGKIEALTPRNVVTRFGPRNCYNIRVGGVEYQLGFGKPTVSVGEEVTFEAEETKYGMDIKKGSLVSKTLMGALKSGPSVSSAVVIAPTPFVPKSHYADRKFPIDALSPERAIIRQNAMNRASEVVLFVAPSQALLGWPGRQEEHEILAHEMVRVARIFEAYSSGDSEVAAAKDEVAKGA